MNTRVVTLTAARTYVGQITIEIPVFCPNDRLRGLIAGGSQLTRFLTGEMTFGRVVGTGLANPVVTDFRGSSVSDLPLSLIAPHLRSSGFHF
jgi:hypothetical protein